jgi:hypothetical protein
MTLFDYENVVQETLFSCVYHSWLQIHVVSFPTLNMSFQFRLIVKVHLSVNQRYICVSVLR